VLIDDGATETSSQQAMIETTGLTLLRWMYTVTTEMPCSMPMAGQDQAGQSRILGTEGACVS